MKAKDVTITQKWLRERCAIEGRHWIWQLAMRNGGPSGHARDAAGKQGQFSVRLAAYRAWTGEEVPPGMTLHPECGDPRCMGERCLKLRPHGGYNKGKRRALVTIQKMAQTQREKVGHDPAKVQLIKDSPGKLLRELAAETGLSVKAVHDIRTGRRWRDYTGSIGSIVAQLTRHANA